MNKQIIFKFVFSLIGAILVFAMSTSIVKLLGLWDVGYAMKFISMGVVGFLVHFLFGSHLKSKKNDSVSNFVSSKIIKAMYWILALIFLVLAGLTSVLMIRNGSFSNDEICLLYTSRCV